MVHIWNLSLSLAVSLYRHLGGWNILELIYLERKLMKHTTGNTGILTQQLPQHA